MEVQASLKQASIFPPVATHRKITCDIHLLPMWMCVLAHMWQQGGADTAGVACLEKLYLLLMHCVVEFYPERQIKNPECVRRQRRA